MNWWTDPFDPGELLRRLGGGGVDFVVVGGVAVGVQALIRATKDLDICYDTASENLERLGKVLVELDASLHGVDDPLPFVPDARTLRRTEILCLRTAAGRIDLLTAPAGAPPYPQLRKRADWFTVRGVRVRVANVDDLLAMKRAAGRPEDLIDVEALEIAKRRLGRRRGRR